eukprot:425018-Amorphochlora_amoeboformis.AAC.1
MFVVMKTCVGHADIYAYVVYTHQDLCTERIPWSSGCIASLPSDKLRLIYNVARHLPGPTDRV